MERETAEMIGIDALVAPLTYAGVEPGDGNDLLRVLERAAEDPRFVAALTEHPGEGSGGIPSEC